MLASNDAEWEHLRPMMNAKTDAEFEALKAGYRDGIPKPGSLSIQSAEKLFAILAKFGGADVIGERPQLAPGTFAGN